MVHHLWKIRSLDKVVIADLHGKPPKKQENYLVPTEVQNEVKTRSGGGQKITRATPVPNPGPQSRGKHSMRACAVETLKKDENEDENEDEDDVRVNDDKSLYQVPVQTMFHRNIWHKLREQLNT